MLCSKTAYTTLLNLKYRHFCQSSFCTKGLIFRYKWSVEVKQHLRRVPKILVVNKCDLDTPEPHEDLLTDEVINKAFADLHMDEVIKISALTGDNIDELIQKTGRLSRRRNSGGGGECILI